ncbi:LacI family DNA-binding transcriptional regulator [Paracoccus sp. P2]|uniref:LacI family DNA-binding transcriptional regulator n=1 Tax=Paracoccus pantotrophus TaxID=82367 RepID=A0A1I5NEF4_PARPN|nr:LacI family DNA-binding transcriptional regulator [Paracoccus pantotrophus]MDF3856544.1 LacI family DNA-binding transcriptional regulator [Paracoccus pantotrophus]QFG37698.1 substrate-binding domain-containing protein [Paracoccus pantotrophus]QLH15263.1 LacI family DNA-binding transcriptional regulator [Paracoccus pantotrophus]RDD99827.1 LacI family DNA-binding transcriptional regulator [Paracoccus pantotrophus]RKS51842.1 LacI family transcriptional regulator [Paracoccus pantotrophus]
MPKVTAKMVADAAGVSLAAVSRAFRSDSALAEDKRARILRVAGELGYLTPSGRTLSRIATGTVSLVAGDLTNPFYPVVLEELSRRLHQQGRRLVLHAVPPGGSVDLVMQQVLDYRSDAAIVTSATMPSRLVRECRKQNLPVVLFNRVQLDARMLAVTCDNYGGGRMAAERLLARGCRRIGHVTGLRETSTHLERARGFLDALGQHGLAPACSARGEFSYDSARQAALSLLQAPDRPEALFCENDIMALAALDVARSLGLRIPQDLAVIGFDDIPLAEWGAYRLTTIRQPVRQMVAEALELIAQVRSGQGSEGTIRVLPVRLIERDSA